MARIVLTEKQFKEYTRMLIKEGQKKNLVKKTLNEISKEKGKE